MLAKKEDWRSPIQDIANRIRLRGFKYVLENNGGYLSQICSSAEIFAYLYGRALVLGASEAPMIPGPFDGVPERGRTSGRGGAYNGPQGSDFDRLFFSPAHYALVLYVTLIEFGRLAAEALEMFNKDGSTVELIGAEHSPGFETTTGSLAQALSHAGGVALGRRLKGHVANTWVMMSDGEFQEGQTWEAVQALSHFELDTVRVIVDVNEQQCDGPMNSVMKIEPLAEKLNAFGAVALDIDGHDLNAMDASLVKAEKGKPLFILARTNPTQGIPIMEERRPTLHYLRFTSDEEKARYQASYDAMVRGAKS